MYLTHHILIIQFLAIGFIQAWSRSNSEQAGKLKDLDVICGKDHMTVRAEFDGPFNGIVSSKGSWGQGNCVYIKSNSGVQHSTFKVMYNECGTKPDLQGKYYENTIVIQYGTDIIEAMDEAKRLRCEWFEAYEKPATFRPAIPVADLDVVEMNFQGDDIDCWMEIQEGKGPWSRPINRIVPVGALMTIVIAIADASSQFDMRVKSCFAHDGVKPPVQLTDEYGCVLRKSMISEFSKIKGSDFRKNLGDNALALNNYLNKATVISYAHFYAFKFPDSMSVQMQCTVEVCRNGCPNACDSSGYPPPTHVLKPKISFNQAPNRKNENNKQPSQQRGNRIHHYQSHGNDHDHDHDLVLDEDVALTAAESNQQPAVLPSELQNHRHTDQGSAKADLNNNLDLNSADITKSNRNEIKLNSEQIQMITTTPKPIYKLNEDALQHENSKLISELKYAGMDLNRFADTLMNTKQSTSNLNNNHNLLNIQRLQNDHLENIFQDERLRELALESGLKLNKINEILPQAQPLIKSGTDNSTIDLDNLLNSVNNLISSSGFSNLATPFIKSISTTSTTTPLPPATETSKDVYLDEETSSDEIQPNIALDDLNDDNLKQNESQEKSLLDTNNQVNVKVLNHPSHQQNNKFKHESLPKNQPKYIVETNAPSIQLEQNANKPVKPNGINNIPPFSQKHSMQLNNNKNQYHQLQQANNKQPIIYHNGHLLQSPNLIQPLINHHHQPLHFQYLPTAFNSFTDSLPSVNSLPLNLDVNSLNALAGFNGLPMNLLNTKAVLPVTARPAKQPNKLANVANLFKQNSLTQYGYSLLQSFKKDNQNSGTGSNGGGLLTLFPRRVGRNARMQIPNRLNLIKLKRDQIENNGKIRTRRSIGSQVSLQQAFQVITPLDMQFNDDNNDDQLEFIQGKSSNIQINETKSLICIQFKSTLVIAFISALILFVISILTCLFLFKRYKKMESN